MCQERSRGHQAYAKEIKVAQSGSRFVQKCNVVGETVNEQSFGGRMSDDNIAVPHSYLVTLKKKLAVEKLWINMHNS